MELPAAGQAKARLAGRACEGYSALPGADGDASTDGTGLGHPAPPAGGVSHTFCCCGPVLAGNPSLCASRRAGSLYCGYRQRSRRLQGRDSLYASWQERRASENNTTMDGVIHGVFARSPIVCSRSAKGREAIFWRWKISAAAMAA